MNLGDSRGILSRGQQLQFATRDHKPNARGEEERIRAVSQGQSRGKLHLTEKRVANIGLSLTPIAPFFTLVYLLACWRISTGWRFRGQRPGVLHLGRLPLPG